MLRHGKGIKADMATYAAWARRLARYSFRTAQLVFREAEPMPGAAPLGPIAGPPVGDDPL
jgi:hypothetical protein